MVLIIRMLSVGPIGWDLSSSAFAVRSVDYAAGSRPGGHIIDRIDAIFFLGRRRCPSSIHRLCSYKATNEPPCAHPMSTARLPPLSTLTRVL